jgi:uncharacterized SAM-binding protein YcdF (DUF218 family)
MRLRKRQQEGGRSAAAGRWRRVRRLASFAGLPLVLYGLGFLWFTTLLPAAGDSDERGTDAIVVLTGGSDRLAVALDLLIADKGRKLFVSGVYRGVDVRQLLDLSQHSPEDLSCCVVLGYEADNTRGNANETAAWMKSEGFTSLRLVTATYHMPRSLLEFRRTMPEVEIVPHPVFTESFKRDDWWLWPGSSSLLISEYTKYLVALARSPFDRLIARVTEEGGA